MACRWQKQVLMNGTDRGRMDMSDETRRSIGQAPREGRGACYSIGEEEGDS